MCFFFFFKQKTAYEMRISDWSSDVCSSDLLGECNRWCCRELWCLLAGTFVRVCVMAVLGQQSFCIADQADSRFQLHDRWSGWRLLSHRSILIRQSEIGRASWRERVCQYG